MIWHLLTQLQGSVLTIFFPQSRQEQIVKNLHGVFPLHISTHKISGAQVGFRSGNSITVTALSDYANYKVSALIHSLKYTQSTQAIVLLAGVLADYLLEEVANHAMMHSGKALMIMPMPLSKRRKQERGFNQMEVLLQEVIRVHSDLAPHMVLGLLLKHKDTKPQTHLSREERLINVRGVFSCKNLSGAHVIIVDDVLTTGATALEASKAVVNSGAGSVSIVAMSRTL